MYRTFQRYLLPGFVFQSGVIAGGYGTGRELVEFFLPYGPPGATVRQARPSIASADHYGDVYVDRERDLGFGIDGIAVERVADGFQLRDLSEQEGPRDIRVVFDDGTERTLRLDREAVLRP